MQFEASKKCTNVKFGFQKSKNLEMSQDQLMIELVKKIDFFLLTLIG